VNGGPLHHANGQVQNILVIVHLHEAGR